MSTDRVAMQKIPIVSIAEKNRTIKNIIDAMLTREHFLIIGHENPDDDCIASMVAFSLLLVKFDKDVKMFIKGQVHEHFHYLLNIARYNSIRLVDHVDGETGPIDTLVVCDTPKPSMIEKDEGLNRLMQDDTVRIIEFDHHMGADSVYIGDEGYRLVTEASSAAELIGHLTFKLNNRKDLLERYQTKDLFSRNLVLAILTGIIGDTKMGQFLKSGRERRYYQIFSGIFNNLLAKETTKDTNFANMEEVFNELQRLSRKEEACYNYFIDRKKFSPSVGWVALSERDMRGLFKRCGIETVVSVARAVCDTLAEESGKISLVAYYDNPDESDLVQFRMRRSQGFKTFDLRKILEIFAIENGGGHEGAIGFRLEKDRFDDLEKFVAMLLEGVEKVIG
ncbi:MAG: DHH family phosphoesterase [Spirochaetes bacterium]|nr:DHH family phosphoesterase [Spirochaetota bacterium]